MKITKIILGVLFVLAGVVNGYSQGTIQAEVNSINQVSLPKPALGNIESGNVDLNNVDLDNLDLDNGEIINDEGYGAEDAEYYDGEAFNAQMPADDEDAGEIDNSVLENVAK